MQEFLDKNLNEIYQAVDSADVLAVGFSRIAQRLLVDTRFDSQEPPMFRVVEQVSSVEERLRELKRIRPRFPKPERFTFFMWPISVASLQSLGVWERVLKQCLKSSYPEVEEQARAAFQELLALERREALEAIAGSKYRSIWQRSG